MAAATAVIWSADGGAVYLSATYDTITGVISGATLTNTTGVPAHIDWTDSTGVVSSVTVHGSKAVAVPSNIGYVPDNGVAVSDSIAIRWPA